jgi:hypothetical protein
MHAAPFDRYWNKEFIETWKTQFGHIIIFLQILQVLIFLEKHNQYTLKKYRGPDLMDPASLVLGRPGSAPRVRATTIKSPIG